MERNANVKRIFVWITLCLTIILCGPGNSDALTFQFDQNRPGVREIIHSYVRFPVQGREMATVLPSVFYIVTTRSEEDTVFIAKVGNFTGNPKLTAILNNLSGKLPQKIKGPHGETVFSHPKPAPKALSAYAIWGEWLFIAKNKEALLILLKRSMSPQSAVTPPQLFLSDGLPAAAGIRFWGENRNGELTNLLKEGQSKILIPVIKDPAQVARLSGILQPASGRKLSVQMTVIPASSRHALALKGDLKFISESIRRRLSALQVTYQGNVTDNNGRLEMKAAIGDYLKAKTGLVKART